MAVEGMSQSLYSSCSSSEDCGDHQVCDLQGRKECQCLPDYHVSSMQCIRAVGRGEPCTEEISCRLADRSLRCTTSPGHSLPSCQCKEDTRWNGTRCVSGGGKEKERPSFSPAEREVAAPPPRDSSTSIILSNLMGPLGLILTILIIVGVCIIIHNHK